MLTWFDNPPRRRGKARKRGGKRKLYGAAAKAHARALRKRKGGSKMAKRRKSRKKLYGAAAAAHARASRRGSRKSRPRRRASARRRTWRRTSATVARRAGRQLRYRRSNPPFGRGIVGQLVNGVQDAAWIVGGKAASRIIAGFIPVAAGGQAVNLAVQAAAAVGAGYVGRFISPNASRMMLAGGLAGVVETFVKSLNLPLISPALGDDYYTPGPLAVGAYPQGSVPGVSAYPQLMAGDEDEDMIYQ